MSTTEAAVRSERVESQTAMMRRWREAMAKSLMGWLDECLVA